MIVNNLVVFYLFNLIIGGYFLLTTIALKSEKAQAICIKMYNAVDYSIDNHKAHWIMGTLIATGYFICLWSSVW
jgi:hypothetical protein